MRRRRKRHAASRARKLTAVLSGFAFLAIGQAINLAAPAATSARTAAVTQGTVASPSTSVPSRSTAAPAGAQATKAVTSTHAS